MKHTKTFILLFLLIITIICLLFVWGIYFPKDKTSTERKIFVIEKGQDLFDISRNLKNQELIKNRISFNVYVGLQGKTKSLQAGEYELSPSMSVSEIAKKIISGQVIKNIITIPEGWNLRDIGWYFENKGMFMAEELFELAGFPAVNYNVVPDLPQPKDFSNDYDFLKDLPPHQYIGSGGKSPAVGLEGYLFPDTYQLNKDEKLESIIRRMLDNFDKKLTQDLREEINNQEKTIFEIVTMASLLEKEVKTKEDKEIVAGILWKRLENSIALQVDATISYITGKKTTKIPEEETQIDSFYNTYKYPGLPLGPICNPGLESILTALYPKDSDYWYYLSVPETGETIFSKTLEEHNVAKEKYLKTMPEPFKKIAIIIAFRDFRDEEYFIPKQNLIRADFSVDTVSTSTGQAIGAGGGEAQVNVLIDNFNVQDYDAVLFIGGPGASKYIDDEKFHQVAQQTVKAGKVLGAICVAPAILAKAGVLEGKKATVWSSPMDRGAIRILEQGGANYQDESVVVDGKIITGNGPVAASQWAEEIIKALGD